MSPVKPGFTVRQVAKFAGVCERTVWNDIAAGRLKVNRLPNGWPWISASALTRYRGGPVRDKLTLAEVRDWLWSQFEVRKSQRTLRRMIATGKLKAVRISPRRLLVRRRDVFEWLPWLRVLGAILRQERQRAAKLAASRPVQPPQPHDDRLPKGVTMFSVHEVAALSGRTVRQVYHDVEKGALEVRRYSQGARRILIHRRTLSAYLDR